MGLLGTITRIEKFEILGYRIRPPLRYCKQKGRLPSRCQKAFLTNRNLLSSPVFEYHQVMIPR